MKNLHFPLEIKFNIATIHNDFTATDASGEVLAYVKQKILRLKDEIEVFRDDSCSELIYHIRADRWIDFNAAYLFTKANGADAGRIVRHGWKSLWKSHYEIFDERQASDLTIREAQPWVKVMDGLLGEIPILGIFTGYFFNPSYHLTRPDGTLVATLTKQPSFWGRKFIIEKETSFESGEEERIVLGMMMMLLMERRKG